jgi:hypothetical protein
LLRLADFAVSEEVSLRDKKSAANRLKAMASMEVQQINPKGKPSCKNLLSEFAGEFSNNKKREERLLSVALEKAEIPHRRIRVWRDREASRITLYAVTDRGKWKAASNASWSAQWPILNDCRLADRAKPLRMSPAFT